MADSNKGAKKRPSTINNELNNATESSAVGTALNSSGSNAGDVVVKEGTMTPFPPPSKRRKFQEDGDDDVNCSVDTFKLSNKASVSAAADDNLDDRKPAAKPEGLKGQEPADGASDDDGSRAKKSPERTKCNNSNDNDENKSSLPIAPSLDEYLKSGGHTKYAPRPEWCHFSNESTLPAASATAAGTAMAAMPSPDAGELNYRRIMMMEPMIRNDPSSEVAAGRREPLMPVVAAAAAAAAVGAAASESTSSLLARIQNEVDNDGRMMNNNHNRNNHNHPLPLVAIHRDRINSEEISNAIHAVARAEVRLLRRNDGREHHRHHHRQQHPPLPLLPLPLPLDPPAAAFVAAVEDGATNDNMPLDVGNNRGAMRQVIGIELGHRRDLRHRHFNQNHHHRRHGNRRLRLHGPVPPADEPIPADGLDNNGPAPQQHLVAAQPWFANPAGQLVDNNPNNAMPLMELEQQQQRHRQQEERLENLRLESLQVVRGNIPMIGGPATDPLQSMGGPAHHGPRGSAAFGLDCDSALHLAIKQHATEAALDLIRAGACVEFSNAKGITPLMIASQEGTLEVVQALLNEGALPNATTIRGSTPLIQACHFGKFSVVEELLRHGALVDQANLKNTTALMRASQEGHEDVVLLLLSRNASVNRRNDERMTALMLSSQRGHGCIVSMLVKAGAQVDSKTAQDSTSLMLACKRKHFHVARILVASGTELKLKDCKNRTVLETATRRGNNEFCKILTDSAQVQLMQEDSRRERNFEIVRIWKLLQSERAMIRLGGIGDMTIHSLAEKLSVMGTNTPMALRQMCPSKQAFVQAMTLPAPLIELISSFIPLPLIWEKRLILLTSRSHIDPDSAVSNALDLIDEVLEVGGIIEAFGAAGVTPPSGFESWSAYQLWCGKCDVILSRCTNEDVTNIFAQESGTEGNSPENLRQVEPSQTQRRACNYLQVLARAPQSLTTILSSHPYDMPRTLFGKLKACHDIQSVVRRLSGGGIHFETGIANEMVVMARMAVMWCESRPMY